MASSELNQQISQEVDQLVSECTDTTEQGAPSEDGKQSTATRLVNLAMQSYRFGSSSDGGKFAVALNTSHVATPLSGDRLQDELAKKYFQETGKVAGGQALRDALAVISGMCADSDPEDIHLRVGQDQDGTVWVFMADEQNRVIHLTPQGWNIQASAPVLFKKTVLTAPFPYPADRGDLAPLWELLNFNTQDRPLVVAWIMAALLRPNIPHPVAALFGEQGSGKSTATRRLAALIDPSHVPTRRPPTRQDEWPATLASSYGVAIDNLSGIPAWLSDALCRAVTGDGDVRRKLYTDGDVSIFSYRRVILLNGIDVGAIKGDLAERLIIFNLERFTSNRKTEAELAQKWEQSYPAMFAGLLDLACKCLARLEPFTPQASGETVPRMADFGRILQAVDAELGTDGMTRYLEQPKQVAANALEAEPFLKEMLPAIGDGWSGTIGALLERLENQPTVRSWVKGWPRSGQAAIGIIKRNAPALRALGWSVEQGGYNTHLKQNIWYIAPQPKVGM